MAAALSLLLWAGAPAAAQRIVLPTGEYMDTTSLRNPGCGAPFYQYYQVKGKYPVASATLARQAQAFLQQRNGRYTGTGLITFRFGIDCEGKRLPWTKVLQTDAAYRPTHFAPALVEALYAYLQTLTEWRRAAGPNREPANYLTLLSFRIQDGKVVAVTP
ncbi:hypothetical protein [Solirubrum puertoriconensis]|uniref:TonB C-terminal domain-containing protein n=1 Tax=Solirubrum puertoriconensis TaxID=1751427 RepID=A0A9X0L3X5_SOLP1|nr:hypothetical protein [Solirubrum puertoriconensis]KUG06965.1 hypothetical protein ASU33_06490 [Solirubrum puertoriconensis]